MDDQRLPVELVETVQELEAELRRKNEELNYLSRELQALKTMLKNESFKDELTGLYNKLAIESILHYKKHRSDRSKKPFSILLVDISGLDKINQEYGRAAGDKVLTDFAKRLIVSLRAEDAIARWGDDKFIAVLSDCYYVDAEVVAKKIQFFVKDWEVPLEHTLLDYAVRIGISQYNQGETLPTLMERAEVNLRIEKDKKDVFKK